MFASKLSILESRFAGSVSCYREKLLLGLINGKIYYDSLVFILFVLFRSREWF